jgi:MFS family permease
MAASGIARFLGLRRNVALLLVMLVLVGLGEKLFQRFLPRYLDALGAGPLVIGLYGFLDNGLGALYALPGGRLTDRLGNRRSLLLFASLNLIGYGMLAIPAWPTVLVALLLCTAWSQLSLPATFALVAQQLPKDKRVMGLAVQGVVRRIPMGLGPVLGGAAFTAFGIVTGMHWVLLAAAGLTLFALYMQWRFSAPDAVPAAQSEVTSLAVWRGFRPELRHLLASDILIRFCEQIPNAFVVLWVVERLGRTDAEFGVLTAIEMATAASLYIPVAWWVDRRVKAMQAASPAGGAALPVTERGPFILATFVLFSAFPLMLLASTGAWTLGAAFVVRGLKEFGEPARKATIVDLAAEGLQARTVGVYYFVRDSIVACAAMLGGLLWRFSPELTLWTAFGFGILGTLVFLRLNLVAKRRLTAAS